MYNIIKNMNEVMGEIRYFMNDEIVIHSPQLKQQLEDLKKNMDTMIGSMDGFLGNFEQVQKHQEYIRKTRPVNMHRKDHPEGGYHVA